MNRSMPGLPVSISISWSSLRLMSIESVMPSSHLTLCHPLLLLPPIPPSIRVFSNESTLSMRWPKYRSFSFSISPSNEHPYLSIISLMEMYSILQTKVIDKISASPLLFCKQVHQYHLSRFHIYMCVNIQYFSLSDSLPFV